MYSSPPTTAVHSFCTHDSLGRSVGMASGHRAMPQPNNNPPKWVHWLSLTTTTSGSHVHSHNDAGVVRNIQVKFVFPCSTVLKPCRSSGDVFTVSVDLFGWVTVWERTLARATNSHKEQKGTWLSSQVSALMSLRPLWALHNTLTVAWRAQCC